MPSPDHSTSVDAQDTPAQDSPWRNRIVETGTLKVDDALFNPANWRLHPKAQQIALEGVLETVGWVQQVVVNQRTGHLVDGHLRVLLADKNGVEEVPAVYVDLTPEEELLIVATLDPIAAMANTHHEKLAELLEDLDQQHRDVADLVSGLAKKNDPSDGSDLDAVSIADPQTIPEKGDLWQLGDHILAVVDPITEWWVVPMQRGDLFLAYPGPFAANADPTLQARMVMFQPDPWIAGMVIDHFNQSSGGTAVLTKKAAHKAIS